MNSSTPPDLFNTVASAYRRALNHVYSNHGTPHWTEHYELATLLHYPSPHVEGDETLIEVEPDFDSNAIRIMAVLSSPGRDCRDCLPLYTQHIAFGGKNG